MKDPISNPIPTEDVVYGDGGGRLQVKSKEAVQADRAGEVDRAYQRELMDLHAVLTTEPGQAFVMRMLKRCGVYHATFSGSHAAASFTDGQRDIGIWILNAIQNIDPELYAHMLLEHVKRQRRLISTDTGISRTR